MGSKLLATILQQSQNYGFLVTSNHEGHLFLENMAQ